MAGLRHAGGFHLDRQRVVVVFPDPFRFVRDPGVLYDLTGGYGAEVDLRRAGARRHTVQSRVRPPGGRRAD
jgi:hypothetical protein